MIYTTNTDFHSEMSDVIDVPDVKVRLLRYYDLLPEEEDWDEELGIILLKLLRTKSPEMNDILRLIDTNLETIYRVSFSLTPEKWTDRLVQRSMNEYNAHITNLGNPVEYCDPTISDILKLKMSLIAYFDLIPDDIRVNHELSSKIEWLLEQSQTTKAIIIKRLSIDMNVLASLIEHLDDWIHG